MKQLNINNRNGKTYCYDCRKEIKIEGKDIKDGVLLLYKDNGQQFKVLKCNACFAEEPGLKNFRKCEVYSRVVGYLRPVQQWNKGKEQEFKERKNYRTNKA